MTIIVGIVCKDAIVMASDGQLTDGNRKSITKEKITELDFKNRTALLAESGLASFSNRAAAILQRLAADTEITSKETVPRLLEQAVRQVRLEQISLYPRRKYSPEQWKKFFWEEIKFDLTIGYYDNNCLPRLHWIEPSECCARTPVEHFITNGCGADLGQYILTEHSEPDMSRSLGTLIAIYAVETAIKHNAYCQHPTRVGIISRPPRITPAHIPGKNAPALPVWKMAQSGVEIFEQAEIEELAEIILKAESDTRARRNGKLLSILAKRANKQWEKMTTELYS